MLPLTIPWTSLTCLVKLLNKMWFAQTRNFQCQLKTLFQEILKIAPVLLMTLPLLIKLLNPSNLISNKAYLKQVPKLQYRTAIKRKFFFKRWNEIYEITTMSKSVLKLIRLSSYAPLIGQRNGVFQKLRKIKMVYQFGKQRNEAHHQI